MYFLNQNMVMLKMTANFLPNMFVKLCGYTRGQSTENRYLNLKIYSK